MMPPVESVTIAMLPVGPGGGYLGLAAAPGQPPRSLAADLDTIAAWNTAAVVTLVDTVELEGLGLAGLGTEARRRHMEWHHWPIADYQVPDAAFMAAWPARSALLRGLLARGCRVLLHCRGGLGRSGSVAARLLVEDGTPPDAALDAVRAARPGAVETAAQEVWVRAGQPMSPPAPNRGRAAARDRAVGAMLGLAVGDAVGAAIEFTPKPRLAPLDDMKAGGPHELQRGQWTDDTAMALALADSLVADPGLDPADLMRRFVSWRRTGEYSCTGTCFDCGIQTDAALERFRRSGDPLAGSVDEMSSGNGALMRLAPAAIRHGRDRDALARVAALQTCTTHGSPATLAASGAFGTMLADAIAGDSTTTVLSGPAAAGIEWRGQHRDAIEGSGYVVRSLQAAVWAVSRSTCFRSAILLAANLGQDADTTAAIAGQLAGAIYGRSGIPADWLAALAWRERLEAVAGALFDAGWPGAATSEAAVGGTMRGRLQALAAFRPIFEQPGFTFAQLVPARTEGDQIILGGFSLGDVAHRFYQVAYDEGWIQPFDWAEWRATADGQRLMHDPDGMSHASADDLGRVLTTCIRADRFCDGYLAEAFTSGLILRVVQRAEQLIG